MKFAFPCLSLAATMASLSAQTPKNAALPTVEEIVARHIAAAGGRSAWEKLGTQTRKGVALPDSANLPLESASAAPNKWTFTIRMPNGRTLRHGFDGSRGGEERGRVAPIEPDGKAAWRRSKFGARPFRPLLTG